MWRNGRTNERTVVAAPSLQDLLIKGRAASALHHPPGPFAVGHHWEKIGKRPRLNLGFAWASRRSSLGTWGFAPEILSLPLGSGASANTNLRNGYDRQRQLKRSRAPELI